MCLKQISRTLQQKYRPTTSKLTAVYFIVQHWVVLSIPVFTKPILWVFLKFQSCLLTTEYAGIGFWQCAVYFFWNPHQNNISVVDVGAVWTPFSFYRFYDPKTSNMFCQFSSCGPWRVFSHSNYSSRRALGWYWQMSSFRQFCNILCWLEFRNYCPDGGNFIFYCSSSFS